MHTPHSMTPVFTEELRLYNSFLLNEWKTSKIINSYNDDMFHYYFRMLSAVECEEHHQPTISVKNIDPDNSFHACVYYSEPSCKHYFSYLHSVDYEDNTKMKYVFFMEHFIFFMKTIQLLTTTLGMTTLHLDETSLYFNMDRHTPVISLEGVCEFSSICTRLLQDAFIKELKKLPLLDVHLAMFVFTYEKNRNDNTKITKKDLLFIGKSYLHATKMYFKQLYSDKAEYDSRIEKCKKAFLDFSKTIHTDTIGMLRKQLLDVWRHRGVNWGWFRVHCIMYSQWVNLFGDYYEELLDTNTMFQEIHHYFIQEIVLVVESFDIQIDSEFHQMNEKIRYVSTRFQEGYSDLWNVDRCEFIKEIYDAIQ